MLSDTTIVSCARHCHHDQWPRDSNRVRHMDPFVGEMLSMDLLGTMPIAKL